VLKEIELIDYDDISHTISHDGCWSYTGTESDLYAHTMSGTATASSTTTTPTSKDAPKSITFWVSTTKVKKKRVTARMKQHEESKGAYSNRT